MIRFLMIFNGLAAWLWLLSYLPGELRLQPAAWWFTLAFACVVQLCVGFAVYLPLLFLRRRWSLWLLLLFESVRLTLGICDAILFSRTGMHLYSPMVAVSLRFETFWDDIIARVHTRAHTRAWTRAVQRARDGAFWAR